MTLIFVYEERSARRVWVGGKFVDSCNICTHVERCGNFIFLYSVQALAQFLIYHDRNNIKMIF